MTVYSEARRREKDQSKQARQGNTRQDETSLGKGKERKGKMQSLTGPRYRQDE